MRYLPDNLPFGVISLVRDQAKPGSVWSRQPGNKLAFVFWNGEIGDDAKVALIDLSSDTCSGRPVPGVCAACKAPYAGWILLGDRDLAKRLIEEGWRYEPDLFVGFIKKRGYEVLTDTWDWRG